MEKTLPLGSIGYAVKKILQQFWLSREEPCNGNQTRTCKWLPPELGEYKTNFNGAMFNESDEAGIGIVVQDDLGQVLVAMAEKIRKPHNVESLEIITARRAVIFASKIGLQQCQFEGDLEIGIKALQTGDVFSSSFGHLEQLHQLLIEQAESIAYKIAEEQVEPSPTRSSKLSRRTIHRLQHERSSPTEKPEALL
ncbi:hypothetical protein SO802_003738 [Lithocarpus litseifolius]|uniref:RNase H type-1 domain-containing protein n=1 Tax=Lithocarpus litseifolius TaxID=425828 RepID=A0AAW2E2N9_9ROSI